MQHSPKTTRKSDHQETRTATNNASDTQQTNLSPDTASIVQLQRLVGNQNVQRLIANGSPVIRRQARAVAPPAAPPMVAIVTNAVARNDYVSAPTDAASPETNGGAFYYLNGLNPEDMTETLQAISVVTRRGLLDNIAQSEGQYDRPRLQSALRASAWRAGETGEDAISLLDAIRNAGDGSFTPVFDLIEDLPRIRMIERLRLLDRANLQILRDHVTEAAATQQEKLTSVLTDLLGTPSMEASDVIDLNDRRLITNALRRRMAEIYNTRGQHLEQEARDLNIASSIAAGIMSVESGGGTFDAATDRPIVRFENHVFFRQWGRNNRATFDRHFRFGGPGRQSFQGHLWRREATGAWQEFHGNQEREWEVVEFAESLSDRETAYTCMSVGAGQIMGFNHATVGYDSAVAMVEAFSNSERSQISSIFDFIRTNRLETAVRAGDYETLARRYNGGGQVDHYAGLMRNAAQAYEVVTAGKEHVYNP